MTHGVSIFLRAREGAVGLTYGPNVVGPACRNLLTGAGILTRGIPGSKESKELIVQICKRKCSLSGDFMLSDTSDPSV